MPDTIKTRSMGKNFANVEQPIVLSEEKMSRLIFNPQIHTGGIRGRIIRQRKTANSNEWLDDKTIPIRQLAEGEGINIDLNTESVKNFYEAIRKLGNIIRKNQGVEYGQNTYVVADPNEVIITDTNKTTYITQLLKSGYSDEIWEALVDTNPPLATRLACSRIRSEKENILNEFEKRLQENTYQETAGENSWQDWIYKNNWLFGINYKTPIQKQKINITGSMPDYLFPTIDGFVDILEIKLPDHDVIIKDTSHPGAWRWAKESNNSIGQAINYLSDIDRQRLEIEREIKHHYKIDISLLKPRAYVLVGNSQDWDIEKKEALRKMNHALHGIEILTYTQLINRGKQSLQKDYG